MTFEVKACASLDDLRRALTPMSQYFGFTPSPEFAERVGRVAPPERAFAAHSGDAVVGGAIVFPFDLTVPGGHARAAGLSFVAVLPTHRRRGVLRALIRAQIDACRANGEPLAYLWASEDTIYGRFGFGLSGQIGDIDIVRSRAKFHPAPEIEGSVRIVPLADAEPLVSPVYGRVAKSTPGMFARSPAWWQTRLLIDPDWRRRGAGQLQCAVLMQNDEPAAYAFYRLNLTFDQTGNTGNVTVLEAIGCSPDATRAIWRYLTEIDWLPRVRASRLPLDHELHLLAVEPRALNFTIGDGIWVRMVDVAAALRARVFNDGDPIVIELTDEFCPWNKGRWVIGKGEPQMTKAAPDLACDVSVLAAAYLGGFSWARLAAALRVQALKPDAITRADTLFRTARLPWCPELF